MARRTGNDLTLQEVAEQLGVHYMTAYRYVRTGRLRGHQIGSTWYVPEAELRSFAQEKPTPGRGRANFDMQSRRLHDRLIAGDESGAWQVVETALGNGATPEAIYLWLLAPALRSIGDEWAADERTVADEHAATVIASRVIGRLGPSFARPGRRRGTVVLGAAPGDHHDLPVAMLADLVRGAGYRVVDLGGATPVESFIDAVEAVDAVIAVGISVGTEEQLPEAAAVVDALHETHPDVPVLVGGPALDETRAGDLGAEGYGADGAAAVELIDELRARARRKPATPPNQPTKGKRKQR